MEHATLHRPRIGLRDAGAILLVCWLAGCGGRHLSGSAPQDASLPDVATAPDLADRIGPIDLAQAPATLGMTCEGANAALAFKMPCLVGMNLGNGGSGVGVHATECRMAQAGEPVAWSFLLPLGGIAMNPGLVLHIPDELANVPLFDVIELRGERAQLSSFTGTLSFSRVDPAGRAFIGTIAGKAVWKSASDAETTCDVEGAFWGAPGGFL